MRFLVRRCRCLLLSGLGAVWLAAGCSAPGRIPAVPTALQERAGIPGMPAVRTWGDTFSPEFVKDLKESVRREQALLGVSDPAAKLPPAQFLAISGGGANGAFGAGLLCGWTESGTRPQFKLVTGISTGALIAPFAFLGAPYDATLREVYTNTSTKDILEERGLFAAVFDDAMADSRPLKELLPKYVDQRVMEAIAAEYAKGRLLMVATTNLDALRPVIWNIGAIASSKHPKALKLIQAILVASASIPGAFPPVMIDVEVDGKPYQEMHVDGGATAQVFLYPPSFSVSAEALATGVAVGRERHLYILRNARLDPNWADVERRTLNIVGRAISSLIQTQGVGDLFQIYLNTQRDGIDFNLAFIPPDFKEVEKEPFDKEYMRKLFTVGLNLARSGYPWSKVPPGYQSATDSPDAGRSSSSSR